MTARTVLLVVRSAALTGALLGGLAVCLLAGGRPARSAEAPSDRHAAPPPATAADPCAAAPDAAGCAVDHGLALLDRGSAAEGLAWLKAHAGAATADPRYPFALTRAYLALENRIWARRTAAGALTARPDDCEARAWLAWVLVEGGDLAGALEQLDVASCPTTAADGTRWHLLRSFVAHQEGADDAARAALTAASAGDLVHAEDAGLLGYLERTLWPGREPPIVVQGELKLGWSSEPRLGSPVDPQAEAEGRAAEPEDASGLVAELGLTARLGWPVLPWLRPFAELEARGVSFSSEEAWGLSYLRPGGRVGVGFVLSPQVTLRAAYRHDALLLVGGDAFGEGPLWYSAGHTGELDLTVGGALTILAGGGHREYRPLGRSRWEARLRVGGGLPLGERLFLLLSLSGEMNRARNPAYHLWGGTALAELDVDVGRGWSTRARVSVGVDWYPDSAGGPEFGGDPDARRDILVRPALAVWSPTWGGMRFALAYEPSWQLSTAPAYEFVDHRALLYARWSWRDDPWRPAAAAADPARVPLPHGFAPGAGAEESLSDRIRELLRQDEEAQRASSCVD